MDETEIVRRAVRVVELLEEKGMKRDDVVINVSFLFHQSGVGGGCRGTRGKKARFRDRFTASRTDDASSSGSDV